MNALKEWQPISKRIKRVLLIAVVADVAASRQPDAEISRRLQGAGKFSSVEFKGQVHTFTVCLKTILSCPYVH